MIETLWRRYASTWSLEGRERQAELEACVALEVSYADPGTEIQGLAPFLAYMEAFQGGFPGHSFRIRAVEAHHGSSLARWDLLDAAGNPVMPGLSFGQVGADGRFLRLRGFFGSIEALLQ